ncbi:hypothetical protein JCM9957A_63290 [Kineosporia succinea]
MDGAGPVASGEGWPGWEDLVGSARVPGVLGASGQGVRAGWARERAAPVASVARGEWAERVVRGEWVGPGVSSRAPTGWARSVAWGRCRAPAARSVPGVVRAP